MARSLSAVDHATRPGDNTSTHTERVKAAVVLTADGQLDRLRDGLALADTDWRDALMLTRGTPFDLSGQDWQDVLDDELGSAPQD